MKNNSYADLLGNSNLSNEAIKMTPNSHETLPLSMSTVLYTHCWYLRKIINNRLGTQAGLFKKTYFHMYCTNIIQVFVHGFKVSTLNSFTQ
jgi:hypothetical protein